MSLDASRPVAAAFRASTATALALAPHAAPPTPVPAQAAGAPAPRRRFVARVARRVFRSLRPWLRPVVTRWRTFLLAPLHAEVADLRRQAATPRSHGAANRLVQLEGASTRASSVVWEVDGIALPHLAAANELLTSRSRMTATTDLPGLAAVGGQLAAWARGVDAPARVKVVVEFAEPRADD
jgi:hypothetical protein